MNYALLIILFAVILETVADVFFKSWANSNKTSLLIAGLLIYFIGTFVWAYSLRLEYLSKAISIFSVLNLIAIVLVGFFFFNEGLSLQNKIGIGLGIIAVILMQ